MRFPLPIRVLSRSLSWPRRRLRALFEIALPPLSLRADDVERQLQRRNVVRTIAPEVRALTRTLSLN